MLIRHLVAASKVPENEASRCCAWSDHDVAAYSIDSLSYKSSITSSIWNYK